MPRIEEYLPESSGAGPVGGLDPRTEAVGRVGQGIEKVGQSLEAVGMRELHAQSQTDAADAAEAAAQNRVDYNQRVIDETQKGTVDPDKIRQDYQDQITEQAQNYPTALGRNTFLRMSARVGASVQLAAIHGKAQVEGARSAAQWEGVNNANFFALKQDPSRFDDVQAQTLEGIDGLVQGGNLKAAQAEKLKIEAGANNAKAAIYGYMALGATQYKDDNGQPIDGPAIAKHILDSGKLDPYLTGLQKEELYNHIDVVNKANDAAYWQNERKLQKINKDAFGNFLAPDIMAINNGTYDPRKIADPNTPGDFFDKLKMIKQITENAKQKVTTGDPREYDRVTKALVLPDGDPNKITDMTDVMTNSKLSPAQRTAALHFYNNTPEGHELNQDRHDAFAAATKTIASKDALGQISADSYAKIAKFKQDVAAKEKAQAQAKLPMKDLYDPTKPGNVYDMLQKGNYKPDPFSFMNDQSKKAVEAPVETPPGAPPVTAPPQDKAARLKAMHDLLVKKAAERAKGNN